MQVLGNEVLSVTGGFLGAYNGQPSTQAERDEEAFDIANYGFTPPSFGPMGGGFGSGGPVYIPKEPLPQQEFWA